MHSTGNDLWAWPPWGYKPGAEHFATDQCAAPFSDYVDKPFDLEDFYSFFPEFCGSEQYPDSFVTAVAKQAQMFVRRTPCRELDGWDRHYALNLTVAHMAVLTKQQQVSLVGTATPATGAAMRMDGMPGVMTSASVGGVSVSKTGLAQPNGHWEAWYYQTPYGRTLLAFLSQKAAAGLIYNGGENIADCLR